MEKAILNIDNLNISQGMNDSFSHFGDCAIDITGLTYLKAPFTGIVKKIYESSNAVWLESINPVEYADGTVDYMTIMTLHDNDISDIHVGQKINQGQIYYNPGVKGYATGSHIHIAVGKGKFSDPGWYDNGQGIWCINNQYDITKALYLHKDVKITSSMYNWNITDYSESNSESNKIIDQLAKEVISGIWGNNPYDNISIAIQSKVSEILNNNKPAEPTYYIVEKGDCLIWIGQKLNKDWKKIAADNNIVPPYIIYPNQKLIIN